MIGKAALYLRVSTADKGQDVAVQEGPLREWVERLGYETVVFAESGVSGAKTSRRVLDEMMKAVRRREVQAVAVWRLDRLGRSLQHLLQLLQEIESHGGRLLVHDMAVDTGTIQGKLFFSVIGALAEYERGLIAERVQDGLAYAKRHGTKSGRPIGRPKIGINRREVCDSLRARAGEPRLVAKLAKEFGCSRAWIYKNAVPALTILAIL